MKNLLAIAVSVSLIFIFVALMPIHGESDIYDSVIRLHVVANSDSEEDQAFKLKVRDAILAASAEKLSKAKTREEAIELETEELGALEDTARATISDEGYDYPVKIKLCEEDYPTKSYESFCVPSGNYLSLQVLIGDAEGQNWWCVLFPPLCLSAATDSSDGNNEDAFISVGLTGDQYKVITETKNPKYRVRFKILEAISSWFD